MIYDPAALDLEMRKSKLSFVFGDAVGKPRYYALNPVPQPKIKKYAGKGKARKKEKK